jgi:hypothetical protein
VIVDQQTDAVRVRGSFERNRTPAVIVAVLVACIALAVVKPWSADHNTSSGTSGGALPSGVGTSAASASASPRPPDPNAMSCMSSQGGRVLTLVRWPGHEVRTWQSPGAAIGRDPLNASLVPVQILSSHVIGMGVCAFRPDPVDPVRVAAEAYDVVAIVGDAVPLARELGPPVAVTQKRTTPDLGFLFGPPVSIARDGSGSGGPEPSSPPSASASSADMASTPLTPGSWPAWPVGSYALSFRFPNGSPDQVEWLRFDVVPAAGEPN